MIRLMIAKSSVRKQSKCGKNSFYSFTLAKTFSKNCLCAGNSLYLILAYEDVGIYRAMMEVKNEKPLSLEEALIELEKE